jgi:ACT domain-containing protein
MEKRVIISVIGKDQIGIAAGVTSVLAANNINILDINQAIIQGFFTMFVIGQKKDTDSDLAALKDKLETLGEEMGFKVTVQNETVFQYMHRI